MYIVSQYPTTVTFYLPWSQLSVLNSHWLITQDSASLQSSSSQSSTWSSQRFAQSASPDSGVVEAVDVTEVVMLPQL